MVWRFTIKDGSTFDLLASGTLDEFKDALLRVCVPYQSVLHAAEDRLEQTFLIEWELS